MLMVVYLLMHLLFSAGAPTRSDRGDLFAGGEGQAGCRCVPRHTLKLCEALSARDAAADGAGGAVEPGGCAPGGASPEWAGGREGPSERDAERRVALLETRWREADAAYEAGDLELALEAGAPPCNFTKFENGLLTPHRVSDLLDAPPALG